MFLTSLEKPSFWGYEVHISKYIADDIFLRALES